MLVNNDSFQQRIDGCQVLVERISLNKEIGKIHHVTGLLMQGYLPGACVGSVVNIFPSGGRRPIHAEVVGFRDRNVLFMPLSDMQGIGLGAKIELLSSTATVAVDQELLGRVLNGLGQPIDGKGPLESVEEMPIYPTNENPMSRPPIHEAMDLGIRALNGFLTIGMGQRVGIMAGSGVGKSVLLGMMARSSNADVNVVALIGERGREVREFIEKDLGREGLKKSVIVVATSDQSPVVRMRGAFVATTIAEYFRRAGKNVLLMMDSVTRFAMAQREVGLSVGEPPASKGYTPSVFSLLPKLLERAGTLTSNGSITGLYTVLVEGDDMDDPIADAVRSIVDGHIVLSRALAQRGHYPPIDVLASSSRVMRSVVGPDHLMMALALQENMAIYRDVEELIKIGAYKSGVDTRVDHAIRIHQEIEKFLRQDVGEVTSIDETFHRMGSILGSI